MQSGHLSIASFNGALTPAPQSPRSGVRALVMPGRPESDWLPGRHRFDVDSWVVSSRCFLWEFEKQAKRLLKDVQYFCYGYREM